MVEYAAQMLGDSSARAERAPLCRRRSPARRRESASCGRRRNDAGRGHACRSGEKFAASARHANVDSSIRSNAMSNTMNPSLAPHNLGAAIERPARQMGRHRRLRVLLMALGFASLVFAFASTSRCDAQRRVLHHRRSGGDRRRHARAGMGPVFPLGDRGNHQHGIRNPLHSESGFRFPGVDPRLGAALIAAGGSILPRVPAARGPMRTMSSWAPR